MQASDETSKLAASQAAGQHLRQAREARGLTLHDVSDRLKLTLRQLDWIESGDWSRLPGPAVVRGFLRNYAKFLDMEPQELAGWLDAVYPPQPATTPVVPVEPPATTSRSGGKWVGIGLAVLVLLGAGYGFLQKRDANTGVTATADLVEASVVALELPPMPSSAPAVATTPAPVVSSVAVTQPASAPAALSTVEASAPLAVGAAKSVVLEARQEAWVMVTDADGNKLVYGLLPAGTRKEVQGKAPFKLRIGNAAQVVLSYQGQPVNFTDKIRGSTAKLELN